MRVLNIEERLAATELGFIPRKKPVKFAVEMLVPMSAYERIPFDRTHENRLVRLVEKFAPMLLDIEHESFRLRLRCARALGAHLPAVIKRVMVAGDENLLHLLAVVVAVIRENAEFSGWIYFMKAGHRIERANERAVKCARTGYLEFGMPVDILVEAIEYSEKNEGKKIVEVWE